MPSPEVMACPEGIEPPTHSLEGCCSIQLSYGQKAGWLAKGLMLRDGRSDRIRTYDPLVPNQMRYQTALRSEEVDSICFPAPDRG